jgi:hypothetical protein
LSNENNQAKVVHVQKLWDEAPHNAFTGLTRHNGRFYCCFREADTHVGYTGTVRVLTSIDGITWTSAAKLIWPGADVRDPELSITPDNQLLLNAAARIEEPKWFRSIVWLSKDGREWGKPIEIGDPGIWIWRTTWHKGIGYAFGYGGDLGSSVRLYTTTSGTAYETRAKNVPVEGSPSEHAMVFLDDDTAVCLLRRDGAHLPGGMLGTAKPPYKEWTWKDVGHYTGGPAMIRIPDGRIIAVVRLLDSYLRIGVCWVDLENAKLHEFLEMPGAVREGPLATKGDYGYAGLVWHDDKLWVSYYSPSDGKTAIFLAQVSIPPLQSAK